MGLPQQRLALDFEDYFALQDRRSWRCFQLVGVRLAGLLRTMLQLALGLFESGGLKMLGAPAVVQHSMRHLLLLVEAQTAVDCPVPTQAQAAAWRVQADGCQQDALSAAAAAGHQGLSDVEQPSLGARLVAGC